MTNEQIIFMLIDIGILDNSTVDRLKDMSRSKDLDDIEYIHELCCKVRKHIHYASLGG